MRFLAPLTVALALLTACSGSGSRTTPAELPTPAPGKIAAFDLSTLSDTYDLNQVVVAGGSLVTTDRAGNVYMLDWDGVQAPYVMRMTPRGVISRYTRVYSPDAGAMVVRSDGPIVFSALNDSTSTTDELAVVNRNGTKASVRIPPTSDSVLPIGERPDGSLIISEGGSVYSLSNGKATRLYHQSKEIYASAVTDSSGTVYIVPENLGDIVAIPVSKPPYHLHESGTIPGTNTSIAALSPSDTTPASTGGFYATVGDKSLTEPIVVHVQGNKTTVMAENPINGRACVAGKQYPALSNTCGAQAYIAQSGNRILLIGNLATHSPADPALALDAVTS